MTIIRGRHKNKQTNKQTNKQNDSHLKVVVKKGTNVSQKSYQFTWKLRYFMVPSLKKHLIEICGCQILQDIKYPMEGPHNMSSQDLTKSPAELYIYIYMYVCMYGSVYV